MIELSLCSRNFDENIVEFASEYLINSLRFEQVLFNVTTEMRKAAIVQALFVDNCLEY
jgi:hypothetical protein